MSRDDNLSFPGNGEGREELHNQLKASGWTPFSGSSKAKSEPLHGFTAIAQSASTRRVPFRD